MHIRDRAPTSPYGSLMFEDRAARDCYRRGVRDALEIRIIHQPPPHLRALQQWVLDLEQWTGGTPPPPPDTWPEAEER